MDVDRNSNEQLLIYHTSTYYHAKKGISNGFGYVLGFLWSSFGKNFISNILEEVTNGVWK